MSHRSFAPIAVAAMLVGVGCSREPAGPPPPPPPSSVRPPLPPPEPPAGEVSYVFQVKNDRRSAVGLACWGCYLRARDELKRVPGVREAKVHPDAGLVEVRYEPGGLRDRAELVAAIGGSIAGVEVEPLGAEMPPVSRRVRMTNEIPEAVRPAFDRAGDDRPLVVVRSVARGACAACVPGEPAWGDRVVATELDLDAAPDARAWLAPEAVPEWVCFDRRGKEVGRWRGAIDPASFPALLEGMLRQVR